jgi:hypothetical protein
MSGNLLGNETSPYLLQHKDNPVHWSPWGEAALARARDEGRPILLSVGYAACHWCHVMAHESFEDPETAALMNELFVNIKVDREERPDLDAIYQSALAMLGEQGGWPLTMFLTPDGEPFWGGTYFPATPRFGRPSFANVLRGVAASYRDSPDRVKQNVEGLRGALQRAARPTPGDGVSPEMQDSIAERLVGEIDPVHGGIRGAPKFPQPPLFQQLWRAWKRTGKTVYRDAVTGTLTAICQGGIYDHLAGGFARYSVDDRWLAPHFEKMLYDNAQLIDLLTLVWQETRDPVYAARVTETIDWLLRDMTLPEGCFASSLDADSEGVEGKCYVWTQAEIDALLGGDAELFSKHYDVTPHGNWEGSVILNRSTLPVPADASTEATLALCRAILLKARDKRVPPGKDDKALADWNGLMIAALAFAGPAIGRPDWTAAAARAFAFVRETMTENNRLRHSWRAGRLNHPATLDDYANMSRAALALYEATGDGGCLAQAEAWVAEVEKRYGDNEAGGYFFAADDTPNLIVRNKTAMDNPTPSGNGTMAGVLVKLWLLTGKPDYFTSAEATVAAFSGGLSQNFLPLSTLLAAGEMLRDSVQVVLAGEADSPELAALIDAVNGVSLPNRVLQTVGPGDSLPAGHPAHGKGAIDGAATAYVCRGQSCSLPIADPAALAAALT